MSKETACFSSKFLKDFVHDLNSPLSFIYSSSDLLLKEQLGGLNEEQKQVLTKLYKQVKKALELIDSTFGEYIED